MQILIMPCAAQIGMMIETSLFLGNARFTRYVPATSPGRTSPAMPRRFSARSSASRSRFRVGGVRIAALAQHGRDVTDRLGLRGAAQGEIVIAVLQQIVAGSRDASGQISASAPKPSGVIGR